MKIAIFLTLVLWSTTTHAEILSRLISGPASMEKTSGLDREFNSASLTQYVIPNSTEWIAINCDFPDVMLEIPERPGEHFLGALGVGIDDYVKVKITNPLGEVMTVDMDRNDGLAEPIGTQAMILGTTPNVPTAIRGSQFLTQDGAFNSIFTTEGDYRFEFSMRDTFGGSASHGNLYMLINTTAVPEPESILLSLMGIIGVIIWRVKRTVSK